VCNGSDNSERPVAVSYSCRCFFFCQCPGKARKVLLSQGHSNPDEPPSDLSTSSPRLAPSNASLQTGSTSRDIVLTSCVHKAAGGNKCRCVNCVQWHLALPRWPVTIVRVGCEHSPSILKCHRALGARVKKSTAACMHQI
jgi:hypothetical protein